MAGCNASCQRERARGRERERYSWEEERGEKAAPDSCSPSSFAMYIVLLVGSPPSPLATLRFPSFLPSYSPYLSIYLSPPLLSHSAVAPDPSETSRQCDASEPSPSLRPLRPTVAAQWGPLFCLRTDRRERERERELAQPRLITRVVSASTNLLRRLSLSLSPWPV